LIDEAETQARSPLTAVLLTLLSPGLGYMYVGELLRGVALNLALVVSVALLVAGFGVFDFFLFSPLAVLLVTWIVVIVASAIDVRSRAQQLGSDYTTRSYNHWTTYALAALVTYLLPLVLVGVFSHRHIWSLTTVDDPAMYPNVQAGDTVLIRKQPLKADPPKAGDLVAIRGPEESRRILRVVATPGRTVSLAGKTPLVDGRPVKQYPLPSDWQAPTSLDARPGYRLLVEVNGSARYIISEAPEGEFGPELDSTMLNQGQYFLLADHRSQPDAGASFLIRDSRHFGAVRREDFAGTPAYVAWSADPDSGNIRWKRIGLQIQ
jgi:signal peptidase I